MDVYQLLFIQIYEEQSNFHCFDPRDPFRPLYTVKPTYNGASMVLNDPVLRTVLYLTPFPSST
jgi:hypothetical protein